MTRKDFAQDIDRPHYYSQFWIDVASGRRGVSDATPEAEPMTAEDEAEPIELETAAPARPAAKAKPAKAEKKPEPARPTITSLADLANIDLLMKSSAEMEGDEVPDLEAGSIDDLAPFGQTGTEEPAVAADFKLGDQEDELAAENQEEDFFEEDEEEEEDEWGGRRPGRPQKPTKKPRRTF